MCGGGGLGDLISIASIVAAPFTGGLSLLAAPVGMQMSQSEKQAKLQEQALQQQQQAQTQALQQAKQQQAASEQAINMANRRQPNVAAVMGRAAAGAAGGPSGTMLTGPMGVNPQDLQLGKNTLLGG